MGFERRSFRYLDYFAKLVELIGSFGISKTGGGHFLHCEDLVLTRRNPAKLEFAIVSVELLADVTSKVLKRTSWSPN